MIKRRSLVLGVVLVVVAIAVVLAIRPFGPRRDTTPELSERLACVAGQPADPDPVARTPGITCDELIACARPDLSDDERSHLAASSVWVTKPETGGIANGVSTLARFIVVFDLSDGGQRRIQVGMPDACQ
jgi:hypothetical protein